MVKKICLYLIIFYKRAISPALPNSCKFYPTCSQYAFEAIERYGVIKGIYLGAKRILRCNPFSKGGFDPVPLEESSEEEDF
ncbi:MAG: membrane protein insertion efficiency factor YidD [Clostridiales bacterium]|jgi:putative membrane protein insertion efficiency factor|nr:membrane protein insertion efficiency factor YidD [Clostridiales bacterium]